MAELAMREAFGRALADYGALNSRVVALDADTSSSTMSKYFQERFPERFYNIGIAEPCLVDVAVGLALGGLVPYVNAFSALLSLRALEQVRTNLCYARTNVKLAASYAGLSDFKDGPTHQNVMDIAVMRALPEMTVIVPADANEITAWVPLIGDYHGPVYFRLNRSAAIPVHPPDVKIQIGKGMVLRPGSDVTIFAAGVMVGRSLLAAENLSQTGISARVIELHTIKPLDTELVCECALETGAVVTAEEHNILGGLGSAVAEVVSSCVPVPAVRVGIADTFARTGPSHESLLDAYGMAVRDVTAAVQRAIELKHAPSFSMQVSTSIS